MSSLTAPGFLDALRTLLLARAHMVADPTIAVYTGPIGPDTANPRMAVVFVSVEDHLEPAALGPQTQVTQSERYTIDGLDPTATTGTVYSGDVPIGYSMIVKAIVLKTGWTDSPVASAFLHSPPCAAPLGGGTTTYHRPEAERASRPSGDAQASREGRFISGSISTLSSGRRGITTAK